VGLAEEGIDGLAVARLLLEDDNQFVEMVDMFPGFA
jgi:hypothetical protein